MTKKLGLTDMTRYYRGMVFKTAVLPFRSIAMVGALASAALCASDSLSSTEAELGELGLYSVSIPGLHGPSAVAIDHEEIIWIADTESHRVVSFDRHGRQRVQFGVLGGGPGEFRRPQGIAVDENGRVIVCDTGNDRIQVFDSHGTFERSWGRRGTGSAEFADPRGVEARDGAIFVADSGNHRIQIFDSMGRIQSSMGEYGAGPGKFNLPLDVAVDDQRVVWVADARNNRLQRFDQAGSHRGSSGTFGPYAGLLAAPGAIDLHDRRAYVADTANDRIQVFDPNGVVHYQWGLRAIKPREGEGKLHHPTAVAVAPSGEFAVVCEYSENRCQVFVRHPAGSRADTYDEAIIEVDPLSHFGQACHHANGLLVITEPDQHSILVFSTVRGTPVLICRFGGYGRRFGQFIEPAGVFFDARQGRIYVNDSGNRRLQVFQVNVESLSTVKYDPRLVRFVKGLDYASLRSSKEEGGLEWIPEPRAIAVTKDGSIYTVDPLNAEVLVLNSHLELVNTWGGYGDAPGNFRDPAGIAFTADESRVYVADAGNARVQIFDRAGQPLGLLGTREDGPGRLRRPVGLVVARDGRTFVSDSIQNKVLRFNSEGRLEAALGGTGIGPGQLLRPAGLAMLNDESLLVLDFGNHRAQIVKHEGTMIDVFGARLYVKAARKTAAR